MLHFSLMVLWKYFDDLIIYTPICKTNAGGKLTQFNLCQIYDL